MSRVGDLIAVPFVEQGNNKSFCLAQVVYISEAGPHTVAFFPCHCQDIASIKRAISDDAVDLTMPFTIASLSSADLMIERATVLENRPARYENVVDIVNRIDPESGYFDGVLGGTYEVGAYFGVVPLDHFSENLKQRLLPGFSIPDSAWYSDGYIKDVPSQGSGTATDGSDNAMVEVRIPYEAEDGALPDDGQLKLRDMLEDFVIENRLGNITDAGAGESVMDLTIEVSQRQLSAAVTLIRQAVDKFGIDAEVSVFQVGRE